MDRDGLDDVTAEQVLRAAAAPRPVDAEHVALVEVLTAWRAECRTETVRVDPELAAVLAGDRVAHAAPAGDTVVPITAAPRLRGRTRRTVARLAVVTAATLAVTSGLAAAGALPSPVQRAVTRAVRVVGIDLPRPQRPTLAPAVASTTARAPVPSTTAPRATVAPFVPPAVTGVEAEAVELTEQVVTAPNTAPTTTSTSSTTTTTTTTVSGERRATSAGPAAQRRDGDKPAGNERAGEAIKGRRGSTIRCEASTRREYRHWLTHHSRRWLSRHHCLPRRGAGARVSGERPTSATR